MKKYFVLTIGLLSAWGAVAQSSLSNLVQQSFQSYPKLKEAQALIQAGELRVEVAKTALKPFASADASYRYLNPIAQATLPSPDGGFRSVQFIPHNNFDLHGTVGYTLYDFGKTNLGIRRANEDVQAGRNALELNKFNLAYQVAQLYYGIAFLEKSVAVQEDVIKTALAVIQQVGNRVKNGDALELDILTQKVRLETAKNRKVDFENQVMKQKAMLAYLTGVPSEKIKVETVNFDPNAPAATVESLNGKATSNSKELLAANDRLKTAQTDIEIAQKSHLPSIALSGTAGFKNGYVPDVTQLRFNVSAGVGVSIPLYAGKRYDFQIKAAQANLTASKYNLEALNATLRKDIELVLADVKSNQLRLQNIETQLLQADRVLAVSRNRYDNGTITSVELESAQTGIEEARLAQLNFQYQLFMNQLDLRRLTGEEFWK